MDVNQIEENVKAVHHPAHYNRGKFEVIDVVEDWKLTFNIGTCVTYLARYELKESPTKDLMKAWWYLTREMLSKWEIPIATLAAMLPTVMKNKTPKE